jgi:hypothetical protein
MLRKMIKSILVHTVLLVSLLNSGSLAAQRELVFERKIEWFDLAEVVEIPNELGVYNAYSNESKLPVHSVSQQIPNGWAVDQVIWIAQESAPLSEEWLDFKTKELLYQLNINLLWM